MVAFLSTFLLGLIPYLADS